MDLTLTILEKLKSAKPDSVFINSLHQQYCNRGGLSKKQLEGLLAKAIQSDLFNEGQLATLEAIIKKKPTRYKSEKIEKAPEYAKEKDIIPLVNQILAKFPQHKMVLIVQSKLTNNQAVSDFEINEIKRLSKVLLK